MCLIFVLWNIFSSSYLKKHCFPCLLKGNANDVHMCVYGKYDKSLAKNCCVISSILSVTQRKLNAETQLAHKA